MRDLLSSILAATAPASAMSWLGDTIRDQEASFQKRPFYYAFSGVSRHFDKRGPVEVSDEQAQALDGHVPGFSVKGWDQFRLARVILLLTLGKQDKGTFLETIAALLNTADLREQAAIYSAFPLLPHQEDLVEAAVDGLRSNIIDIFDSIALQNPFPATHFSKEAWNQMVLKAIFISRPLYRIVGIESRSNADLADGVSYLAHERWAAGRKLTPEAWRHCAAHVTEAIVADLEHLLNEGDAVDHEAAALVIVADGSDRVRPLHERIEAELDAISGGSLTWERLGEKLEFPATLNGSPARA
jgi:hypothetical protein